MLIAHVTFKTAPQDRPHAIATLLSEVAQVRAMPGCLDFVPFLDPTDPQAIRVLHEWQTADGFAAYLASDGFANIGQTLRPLMVEPPVSKRFDAQIIEAVN